MAAGARKPLVQIEPQRRFALRSKPRAAFVARTQDISERRQCGRVEAHAGVESSDFQSDEVVHDDLQRMARSKARGPETILVSGVVGVLGKSCRSCERPSRTCAPTFPKRGGR